MVLQRVFLELLLFRDENISSVVEWWSIVIVISMVSVQNLLAPFCCVLGKETLWHFPLLGSLGKQFQISVISLYN